MNIDTILATLSIGEIPDLPVETRAEEVSVLSFPQLRRILCCVFVGRIRVRRGCQIQVVDVYEETMTNLLQNSVALLFFFSTFSAFAPNGNIFPSSGRQHR